MAAELINEIVGKEAYEQVRKLDEQLGELVKKFENNTRAVMILERALANAKSIEGLEKATKDLNEEQKKGVAIAEEIVSVSEQKTTAVKKHTDAINAQQKAELQAQIAATEWANTQKQATTATGKHAKAKRDLTKETIEEKMRLQQSTQELKNRIREESNAKGSLEQRRAALIRLRTEYDRLSPLERDTAWGQRMNKTIAQVDAQVLALEKSTGRAQRNVGNYLNAAWGGIRQLAYLIPGLGIAGMFDLIAQGIGTAVTSLLAFTDESQKLNEIRKKGVELSAEEVVKADAIYSATQNLALSTKQRNNYVDELQKMYPAYFGNLTNEEILAGKAAGAYTRLKNALVSAGIARATQDEMGSVMKELLQLELKNIEREEAIIKERKSRAQSQTSNVSINGYSVTSSDAFSAGGVPNNTDPDIDRQVKKQQEKYDKLLKVYQKYLVGSADLEKSYAEKSKKDTKESTLPNISPNLKDSDLADLKAYYENIRKWQMEKLGDMVNDPESRKLFDEFILGEALSGDKSVSDAKAQELAKELEKWSRDNADKLALKIKIKLDNEKMIKEFDQIVEAVKVTNDALTLINDIQYNREMQQIDERNKALEASYDMEKKQIESRGLTQQQKANELANLEARREAERKRIDRERITAERRRALQQKGIDIANIISSGALAIVKQLAATPLPAGAPAVALVAATNGIALARAIAAPIPQYKHGTESHPGGLAEVGDGGQHELVTTPDGKKFITPNKSTIMDLPVGAKVKPLKTDELMKAVYDLGIVKLANMPIVSTNEMQQAMIDTMDDMTKTMKGVKNEIGKLKHSTHFHGDIEHFFRMKKIIS